MEKKLKNFATIQDYNDMLGVQTLHPLVSVIDLSTARQMEFLRHTMSFYTIFLKDERNCELTYGRTIYDYDKGDVVCLAPGQVIGVASIGEFQPAGWALMFDAELIHGTPLGRHINEYSFFSYEVNEALHLSESERDTFINCLMLIQTELNHSIDHLSKRFISSYIEILLNYCLRFYERQFETRKEPNKDILTRFEALLDKYFEGGNAMKNGLPNVKFCASELCLSPNYFGDLIKKETGKAAQEYIKNKITEITKEALLDINKSITDISYELGFQYPQHLSRFFKKEVGVTPAEYRSQMIAV